MRLAPLFLLLAAPAWASSTYPGTIRSHLQLAAEPPQQCALCHTNGLGTFGTVNTPFGAYARTMQGLVSSNDSKLTMVLDAMDTAMVDNDADGVPDIAELRAGTDPNTPETDGGMGGGGGAGGGGGTGVTVGPLKYGCGANVVPELCGLASVFALWGLRRRRRR